MTKIAKPTEGVRKFLMLRARGKTENKDNPFFISAVSGELISSGYLQGNGDWFPTTPKGTYCVEVEKEMKKMMKTLIGVTTMALISVLVGQIAKYGAIAVAPETLSYVVGIATLVSMFVAIAISKED